MSSPFRLWCLVWGLLMAAPASSWAAAPLVVIDPGHGGYLPGTVGLGGIKEKQVTLRIAEAARKLLQARGIRVVMTRSADTHVSLASRAAYASRRKARAFISIHANHAPIPERRGAETYILSAKASDEFALALLRKEEGVLAGAKAQTKAKSSELDFILSDLSHSAAHEKSAKLARSIQNYLKKVSGLLPSRGLRQAPFQVLREAAVPAALVEVGYLSNPAQAKYLSSAAGQKAAGRAIARGVLSFLGRR